jgi:crossover junction endodeoxyribonuclease RuvC
MTRFVGIDPSTKTGFVALDEHGNVLKAKELTGVGSHDPKRMVTLIDEIMDHLQQGDVIGIESPANHATGSYVGQMFGIAWGIRMALFRRGWIYKDITPSQVKKFATGKGNTKKDEMVLPIYRKWGFEHRSDNVRDAFVLAQIIKAISNPAVLVPAKYEAEVIEALLNPPDKKKGRKVSK